MLEYSPTMDVAGEGKVEKDWNETIEFVPYCARANRSGKEMMRVGLRVL